jgi:hypothetical protein
VLSFVALVAGCSEYDVSSELPPVELPPGADAPPTVPPADDTPAPTDEPPADDTPADDTSEDPAPDPDPIDPPVIDPVDPSDAYAESWTLPSDAPVDIVVFGDTSGSMSDELEELGTNMAAFTNRLVADGVDWRLMAVNGDEGCGVDGWFDAAAPDWQTRFTNALLVEPEDYDEAGLLVAALAIEATGPGECNADFLRSNALLHVVFISDEVDQSPGYQTSGYYQDYVDRVVAVKGDPALVTFSAVAGPVPGGCADAEPGEGYYEAVGATGGNFSSICGAWSTELGTLAGAAVVQDTFTLASPCDPVTVDVSINGVEVPNADWIFDPAANAVEFVANPPAPGDSVSISYSSP